MLASATAHQLTAGTQALAKNVGALLAALPFTAEEVNATMAILKLTLCK